MESFFSRYRNPMILGMVLLLQVFGLAVQVKRPLDPRRPDSGSVRLIRLWVSATIMPIERIFTATGSWIGESWHGYLNVNGLRRENRELREQNEKLMLEQARIADQANQAQRLQALLDFKQHFIAQTVAAQVIGSSGTDQSRVLYIDRGSGDGLKPDMAVITPDGIVGKVQDVFPFTSQVLVMNDLNSGVGALLEKSRLHGVVKGTAAGDLILDHIMVDEKVEPGDRVLTSGGDRIYPKGLPVGTVEQVSPGPNLFLNIRISPAADLNRLEEVLVVTQPQLAQADTENPVKAADILAQRLPGVNQKPEAGANGQPGAGNSTPQNQNQTPGSNIPKTNPTASPTAKQNSQIGIQPNSQNAPQSTPTRPRTRQPATSGQPTGASNGGVTPQNGNPQNGASQPAATPATTPATTRPTASPTATPPEATNPK